MTADQLRGKLAQFKGILKQEWGKCIDDDLRQIEGNYEKVIGMLQERHGSASVSLVREQYGQKKNDLLRWAHRRKQGGRSAVMSGGKGSSTAWIARSMTSVKNLLR